MRTLCPQDLVNRSDAELSALFNLFNEELCLVEPFTPEWRTAYSNIEAIKRARELRISRIRLSWS